VLLFRFIEAFEDAKEGKVFDRTLEIWHENNFKDDTKYAVQCNAFIEEPIGTTDYTLTMVYVDEVIIEIHQSSLYYGLDQTNEFIYILEDSKSLFGDDYTYHYKVLKDVDNIIFSYYEKIVLLNSDTVTEFLNYLEMDDSDYINRDGLIDLSKWIRQFSENPQFNCDNKRTSL
jgi:hypothetical protein